jgi:hypothetical protein
MSEVTFMYVWCAKEYNVKKLFYHDVVAAEEWISRSSSITNVKKSNYPR